MRAGGGGRSREAAALWLWLLLIATACGFVFVLLNLPDHSRFGSPGGERTGGSQLSAKETLQIGEVTRLNVVAEEIEGQADEIAVKEDERISRSPPATREKIWMMQDQLIMARAYLQFASPHGSTHLVRELKLRMKEIERAISHSSSGSRVPRSALQKMRAMELTLSKAQRTYPHCSQMTSKLRAMTHNSEELVRAHRSESSFLEQVAVRTLPKGHHCLAMQLTLEYFSLDPKEREFPRRYIMRMGDFYHYAIFSDNILASAVVINSTVASSKDPKRIVFHVVTDALNFPAMMMWFLTNPPKPATIRIESLDDLKCLPADFTSRFKQKGVRDPRYTSALNHLRFYLPEVFPSLRKVLLLDHDVVVQDDLSGLWEIDMKGKVIGALYACNSGDGHHRLENLVNFSDPSIFDKFNAKACVFAFGMNIFDLQEWRKKSLTAAYDKWFQMATQAAIDETDLFPEETESIDFPPVTGCRLVYLSGKSLILSYETNHFIGQSKRRRLWKAGTLPLGQLVFYNHTVPLDRRWHVLGLGHDRSMEREEIENAAVIHYSGKLKPWLEISNPKYRYYWNRFLNYDNTYLQQCNINE